MAAVTLAVLLPAIGGEAGGSQSAQRPEPVPNAPTSDEALQEPMFNPANQEHLNLLGLHKLQIELERRDAGSINEADNDGWLYESIPTFGYVLSNNGWGQKVTASAPFVGLTHNRPAGDDSFDGIVDTYLPRYRFDIIAIQHGFSGLDVHTVELLDERLKVHLQDIALGAPHLSILSELYGVMSPGRDLEVDLVPHRIPIRDDLGDYSLSRALLVAAVDIFNGTMAFGKQVARDAFVDGSGSVEGTREAVRYKAFGFIQTGISMDEEGISAEGVMAVYRLSPEIASSLSR